MNTFTVEFQHKMGELITFQNALLECPTGITVPLINEHIMLKYASPEKKQDHTALFRVIDRHFSYTSENNRIKTLYIIIIVQEEETVKPVLEQLY